MNIQFANLCSFRKHVCIERRLCTNQQLSEWKQEISIVESISILRCHFSFKIFRLLVEYCRNSFLIYVLMMTNMILLNRVHFMYIAIVSQILFRFIRFANTHKKVSIHDNKMLSEKQKYINPIRNITRFEERLHNSNTLMCFKYTSQI